MVRTTKKARLVDISELFGSGITATPPEGGTDNYNELLNKPKINGVVLSGNKSPSDFSLVDLDDLNDLSAIFGRDSNLRVPEYRGNIDNIVETRIYNVTPVTIGTFPSNRPTTTPWEFLITYVSGEGSGFIYQSLFGMTYYGSWFRIKSGGTWNPWHQLFDDYSVIPMTNGGTGATSNAQARVNLNVPGLDANGKVDPTQASSSRTAPLNGGYLTSGYFNQVSTGTYILPSTAEDGAEIEVYQTGGTATISVENGEYVLSAALGSPAVSCTISTLYGVCGFKHLDDGASGWWVATGDIDV